jgi:hypothetical protein
MKNKVKYLYCLSLVVLLLCAVSTTTFASGNAFRNLNWGDPSSSLGEYNILKNRSYDSPNDLWCEKVNEDMNLGLCVATKIKYRFWNNKLYGVVIWCSGTDWIYLNEIATIKFGTPYCEEKWSNALGYIWRYRQNGIECTVASGVKEDGKFDPYMTIYNNAIKIGDKF